MTPAPAADLEVEYLVAGAGVSGLSFASWLRGETSRRRLPPPRLLVVEAADEPGGYCRTVSRDGFVWDYSGHFFHFRYPEIEAYLRARMSGHEVRTIERRAKIRFAGRDIDYPFQAHLHQLPQRDFLECLAELYAASATPHPAPRTLAELLQQRLGRGICERFLVPYNEKLYACALDELDPSAMGRFFPQVGLGDVLQNLAPAQAPRRHGYNATFTYPAGGAFEYVRALLRDVPDHQLALAEPLVAVDLAKGVATTARRRIAFRHLVSSLPLPALLAACGRPAPANVLRANAVAVLNLGFDRKGRRDVHWMYVPDRARCFYRVGWYDNLLGQDRQSLYVEVGLRGGERPDPDALLGRVLADLRAEGLIIDHRLVAWHHVVLDPAYVHLTPESLSFVAAARAELARHRVHSIGRYGGWTYCSIEDNLVEAKALAAALTAD